MSDHTKHAFLGGKLREGGNTRLCACVGRQGQPVSLSVPVVTPPPPPQRPPEPQPPAAAALQPLVEEHALNRFSRAVPAVLKLGLDPLHGQAVPLWICCERRRYTRGNLITQADRMDSSREMRAWSVWVCVSVRVSVRVCM